MFTGIVSRKGIGFSLSQNSFFAGFSSASSLPGYENGPKFARLWGFRRFSANLRAHEPVEVPASSACVSFFGAIGNDQAHSFSHSWSQSVGYLFRRWRPARGGRTSGSSFAERRHDDLLRAIPWPGGGRGVIDGDSGSNRNTSDYGCSDASASAAPATPPPVNASGRRVPTPPAAAPPSCRRIR